MEIKNLTSFIMSILPAAKVFISCPVLRLDDRKANATLRKLGEYFKGITNNIILNDNVDGTCVGKKGLHLNPRGSGRLAMNYIALMQRL